MSREDIGKVPQHAGIDLIGLGQHAHGFGEIACLPGIDPGYGNTRLLQGAHQTSLVAAGGFDDDQIDNDLLELCDQLSPTCRVIGQTQVFIDQAHIQVRLGDVDAAVRPLVIARGPSLQIHG
jgi:hypothetical protein